MMNKDFERDPFLDGLSLGVWDEDFDYYLPDIKKDPVPPQSTGSNTNLNSTPIDIVTEPPPE